MSKIKEHLKKHKWVYISVGSSVVLAGITALIVRSHYTNVLADSGCKAVITTHPNSGKAHINGHTGSGKAHINGHTVFTFNDDSRNNTIFSESIVNVIEREGRGHPGYLVRHIETGLVYPSQKAASDAFDINYMHMSDHLNGRRPHILNHHFERLNMANA